MNPYPVGMNPYPLGMEPYPLGMDSYLLGMDPYLRRNAHSENCSVVLIDRRVYITRSTYHDIYHHKKSQEPDF